MALIPPPVFRLTKQSLMAEALARIEGAGELLDRAVLDVWSSAETHAHIREYLHRTLGKWLAALERAYGTMRPYNISAPTMSPGPCQPPVSRNRICTTFRSQAIHHLLEQRRERTMSKPVVMRYNADLNRAMPALTSAIAELGYTAKTAHTENGLITFETGMSIWSWTGQKLSVHVVDVRDGIQISIGGSMKPLSALLQAYDWGESRKIATKVFDQLGSVLGPGELVRGSISRGVRDALIPTLIIGLIFIVLCILAMAVL
jgi:hypothetical protein